MLPARLGLAGVALLALACAPALQPLQGEPPGTLGAGEALLILHVDTDVPLAHVQLNRGRAAEALPKGHHVWLVRAAPGSYRFSSLKLTPQAGRARAFQLPLEDEFRFRVEAGSINYPGALVVRSDPYGRPAGSVRVRNRNRSALAVRRLRDRHPELLERHPLRYAGQSGDTFLEHYTATRTGAAGGRP